MIVVFDKNYSQLENESVLKYKKSMDPKGRLSSQMHFLVPLGITYSDSLHCGNTLDQTHILESSNLYTSRIIFIIYSKNNGLKHYF